MTWSVGAGLEGRAVLVTGATGGIGAAAARAFAAAGACVAVSDLDQARLEQLVEELGGGKHAALTADLRDRTEPERLVAEAARTLGRIDVLVHAAAVLIRRAAPRDVTDEDYDLQHDVNLRATFLLDRAAAETMRAQGTGGRIVNFASQAWWTGGFGGSLVYSATKGGLVTLVRGLARAYGPSGILVNCVAPGAVDTPMLTEGLSAEEQQAFTDQIPLGRPARVEEIAGVAVFLASDHATYINGATLNVSGGQLMY